MLHNIKIPKPAKPAKPAKHSKKFANAKFLLYFCSHKSKAV